ncbi:GNAT family N-acetyltransferase [Paenibacillus antarcticus]|uniref:N-acetyltransferase domain-containing protein n=1 Tax=Paenibacillus antarcticus TaxID=253703 RepID=A0A168PIY3_9BACL|nr:GNAT family N-acetyltransferase [Paenibacillus antarcticus]OAB46806.1 hypothetical protein PBAT_09030 [Paenibacillus antarcticus]
MLSNKQLQDIQSLQQYCEDTDHLSLKLNWETLRSRKPHDQYDYFHYSKNMLIGFLGVYKFGSKFEICGMVHPAYRRQGIFTSLFQRAIQDTGVIGYASLLLNSPANSVSGERFLHTIPCQYECSEYQMRWNATYECEAAYLNENTLVTEVSLRTATPDDIEDMIRLDKDGFGMSDEDGYEMHKTLTDDGLEYMYVVEFNDVTTGKINVVSIDSQIWIYGFTVDQAMRGQGIGRRTLHHIIQQELPHNKEIWLEVAVHNPKALKLYESCGFVTQEKQDYYQFTG